VRTLFNQEETVKMENLITWSKLAKVILFPALLLVLLLAGTAFVPEATAQDGDAPQLTVITEALNVRGGPGVTYPAVGLLAQGDEVTIIGQHPASGWWQVALPDGGSGWVSGGAAYVSVKGDTTGVPEVSVAASSTAATPSPVSYTTPSTSEAGGTIVFQTVSGGAIYAVDADGSNLRYLTTGMDPALSPDGQWVAFTRWEGTQIGTLGNLWVINVNGNGERIVLGGIHQPKSPTWSPDGTQIAIGMQHGGRVGEERKCSSQRPPRDAYDIDINIDDEGDVSFCYTMPPHPYYGLRVVDVDTGEFEDLPNELFSLSPTWDPANPGQLVFDGERGLMGLYLDQGTIWQLTEDANDHTPVFSPDGSQIAVSYWQNDQWEVHVLNADGSGRVRLTQTSVQARLEQMVNGQLPQPWNNAAPTWSPDGSQIAFLTDRSGQWEIWIMNADGSNQQPLVTGEMLDGVMLQYDGMEERMLSWG
jgi:dipeptidyl aminopeptidase/acylaminoacyl peptidase